MAISELGSSDRSYEDMDSSDRAQDRARGMELGRRGRFRNR